MHTFLSLVAFAIMFLTAFTTAHPRRQLNYCAGDKTQKGYCETLSFTDLTPSASNPPTTQECQNTCWQGIFGEAGDWIVTFDDTQPENYRQYMLRWPCGFSIARTPDQPRNYSFSMHNQDIGDLVDEVLSRFAPLHNGSMKAEGLVRCEGFEARWEVGRYN